MSARSTTKHARTQLLLLFAAVVLVAGLIAVPAAAAATTSLTAKANSYTVTWGKYTIVTATLMDTSGTTPVAVGGQTVRLEWSLTGAPLSWNLLAEVTTDDAQYYTGQYAGVVYPRQLTYYRFNFLGNGGYDPMLEQRARSSRCARRSACRRCRSRSRSTRTSPCTARSSRTSRPGPRPSSSRPTATTATAGSRYKTYKATNYDDGSYTKYKLSLKIAKKGKYRFKASTAAMTDPTQPVYASATTDYSKTMQIK